MLTGDGIPAVNTSYRFKRPLTWDDKSDNWEQTPTYERHLLNKIRLLELQNWWLKVELEKKRIADNPRFDYRGCP